MEESPSTKPRRRRSFFRFSLFALFVAISCVAGYFSGYRWGVDQKKEENRLSTITVATYAVADLVLPPDGIGENGEIATADFDPLIELITSTIDHDTWLENGVGDGEIQPFPANLSLVVTARGATHDGIRDLFQQLRDQVYKLPKEYTKSVQESIDRKQKQPLIVKASQYVSTEFHERLNNNFDSAVRELTDRYGKPQITAAGESGFPDWATAQRIAVWEMSGGKLYFALRDCRPQGEALVAGWWEESFGVMEPICISTEAVADAG